MANRPSQGVEGGMIDINLMGMGPGAIVGWFE